MNTPIPSSIIVLGLSSFFFFGGNAVAGDPAVGELPAPLRLLAEEDHELPRYAEQYYHPFGRVPVVDAMLGDALWSPRFAEEASARLRATDSLVESLDESHRIAALPRRRTVVEPVAIPALREAIDDPALVAVVESAWGRFLAARRLAADAVAVVADSERAWLLEHPGRWFFADEDRQNYRFLTCDTTDHLRIFRTAAEVDRRKLAEAQRLLAGAVDECRRWKAAHDPGSVELDLFEHVDPASGAVLRIAGPGVHAHAEDVDLVIDLGGDDWWTGNAGGTRGTMPAALAIDLGGDDCYEGRVGVQGAGWLGVGLLADLEGDDLYRAEDLSQGAAFIGEGLVYDADGSDRWLGRHFTQAAAAFGTALLRDDDGDDHRDSAGMSGGFGTTAGVGILLDRRGNDSYRCGRPRTDRYTLDYGMGLGSGIGVRDWPWTELPAFYGGYGMLDDATGDDRYEGLGAGLGGAYCLASGVVVEGEGDDDYHGITDSFGASIHLGAGVFIEQAGDDRYRGDNSILGCGGDRGHGVMVDFAGDDRYHARGHALGTGRKPKAVGLFVEVAGDDEYRFGGDSMTATWRPSNPENWAWASFVDLAGADAYGQTREQDELDGLVRGNDRDWSFGPTGRGEDVAFKGDAADAVRSFWPTAPRGSMPFRPDSPAWCELVSAPLIDATWTDADRRVLDRVRDPDSMPDRETVDSFAPPVAPEKVTGVVAGPLPPAAVAAIDALARGVDDVDVRRALYERLDLIRFAGGETLDWSPLVRVLSQPGSRGEDQLAFAGIWAGLDRSEGCVELVADDLVNDRIDSPYARAILVRMVGRCGGPDATGILRDRLLNDPDTLVRRRAAFHLGRLASGSLDLEVLAGAATDPSPLVRCSVAGGLRDQSIEGADPILRPMLEDENLFVRRAAAVALLSRGDPSMVDHILDAMSVASIDTGWNYGRNLFVTMSGYLGPQLVDELGTDLDAWKAWWEEHRDDHDLDASIAANQAAIQERLAKAPSSE